MKKILIFLLFAGLVSYDGQAQAKQTKVLLQQIAALKVYINYAQKGYSIVNKGLKTIADFKRGEFNLHDNYFTSLKMVNPRIRDYRKVGEIVSMQVEIMQHSSSIYAKLHSSGLFYGNETDYIRKVYDRMLEDCDGILDELIAVTTNNQLEMKDDERIERIDKLHKDMNDNLDFCKGFGTQAKLLALARDREGNDVRTGRALHGINDN